MNILPRTNVRLVRHVKHCYKDPSLLQFPSLFQCCTADQQRCAKSSTDAHKCCTCVSWTWSCLVFLVDQRPCCMLGVIHGPPISRDHVTTGAKCSFKRFNVDVRTAQFFLVQTLSDGMASQFWIETHIYIYNFNYYNNYYFFYNLYIYIYVLHDVHTYSYIHTHTRLTRQELDHLSDPLGTESLQYVTRNDIRAYVDHGCKCGSLQWSNPKISTKTSIKSK